jgi:hypothetical protein
VIEMTMTTMEIVQTRAREDLCADRVK